MQCNINKKESKSLSFYTPICLWGCEIKYILKIFIIKVELSPVSQEIQIEQHSEISGAFSVNVDHISHSWLSSEAQELFVLKEETQKHQNKLFSINP